MKENSFFEQIEAYLDNSLSEVEKHHFEQRLKEDEVLQKEVDFQKQMIQGLKMGRQLIDKKQLLNIWQEVKSSPGPKNSVINLNKWWLAGIAASIAMLLVFWWLLSPVSSSNWKDQFFEPYSMRILRAETIEDIDLKLAQARVAYETGDFNQTIEILEQLPPAHIQQEDIQFYKAVSYLGLSEYDQAEKQFSGLINQSNRWDEHARWYLLIIYLEQNQYEQAKQLIEVIEANDLHFKRKETLQIKKALKN